MGNRKLSEIKEIAMKRAREAETSAQACQTCQVNERWLTLDGSRVRYLHAGSGAALLLLHGLLGYAFSWRFTIPVLAQRASAYAPDMLGTGFSDRPVNLDCSLRASAQLVLQFMDELGVSSCDLVGTSRGGGVAMLMAAIAPDRVRRLILADPINPWSARGKLLSVALSNPLVAPLFVRLAPRFPMMQDYYFRRLFGDTRRIPPDAAEGYGKPLQLPGAFGYAISVLKTWNRDLRELESLLPRIADIPTLLVWGSLDAAVSPASGFELKKHFRNCRLVMMEGIGHLPYEEAPEEFNRVLSEFLEYESATPGDVASKGHSSNGASHSPD